MEMISSQALTTLTVLIIAIVFVLGIINYNKYRRYQVQYHSVLITLGILGTFVGVFIGLTAFDANAFEASVPALLAGLKVAFLSSVAGITASLLLRLYGYYLTAKETPPKTLSEQLEELKEAVLASNENTTKAITEATNKISKDFENYNKELLNEISSSLDSINKATNNLISWQARHVRDIQQTSDDVSKMAADIAKLPRIMEDLNGLLEVTKTHIGELDRYRDAINTLKQSTESTFPKLSNNLDNLSKKIEESLAHSSNSLQANTREFQESLRAQLNEVLSDMSTHLTALSEKFVNDYSPLTERLHDVVNVASSLKTTTSNTN